MSSDNNKIKIFVSHRIDKSAAVINNSIYHNVRCGSCFDPNYDGKMFSDNTGENISDKRMSFCELTVHYWAWKNQTADYYGLCHYRRYLSFSNKKYPVGVTEHDNGCVIENKLNLGYQFKHFLFEDAMRSEIVKWDLIAPEPIQLPEGMTNYSAMQNSPDYHNMKDMDLAIKYIKHKYPEMSKSVDEYMYESRQSWLYNCWIMNSELFERYSSWLFDILFYLEEKIDMKNYSEKMLRTPGTIGERLFGIFMTYVKGLNKYKISLRQLTFIKDTSLEKYDEKSNEIIIASNFDNNYPAPFSVFLLSIIAHSTPTYNYKIYVLSQNISIENKIILKTITDSISNFELFFVDVSDYLNGIKTHVDNVVYTNDMYVRVLVPYILPFRKILVLDADMICMKDFSELYNIDIESYMAGAVKDVVFSGYLNGVVPGMLDYGKNVLKLKDPYNYCNTGVLLFNGERFRKKYSLEYLLRYIADSKFKTYEQDILNILIEEDMYYLDPRWNLFTFTNKTIRLCVEKAKEEDKQNYLRAREDPWCIHYAAHPKPWWTIIDEKEVADYGFYFWLYAKKSPYYEFLLTSLMRYLVNNTEIHRKHRRGKIESIVDSKLKADSRLRTILSKLKRCFQKDTVINDLQMLSRL